MKFLKNNWKNILIILLSVLFLSTCARKNNYKRRLSRYGENVVITVDSLERVIDKKTASFDSLCDVNKQLRNQIDNLNKDIDNLNKDIEIYRDQNEKLHNKKVTVIVRETEKEKDNIEVQE